MSPTSSAGVHVEAVFDDGSRLVTVPHPVGAGHLGEEAPGPASRWPAGAGVHIADATRTPDMVAVRVVNGADGPDRRSPRTSTSSRSTRGCASTARRPTGGGWRSRPGRTVRSTPGQPAAVDLVPIGGRRVVVGFAGLVDGPLDAPGRQGGGPGQGPGLRLRRHRRTGRAARSRGAVAAVLRTRRTAVSAADMAVHGPPLGDRVRLGDTGLMLEVDGRRPAGRATSCCSASARPVATGWACRPSHGAILRRRHHQRAAARPGARRPGQCRSGSARAGSAAIGRAGQPGHHWTASTWSWAAAPSVIPGEGLIATPGAVDTHVHGLSPRVMEAAPWPRA